MPSPDDFHMDEGNEMETSGVPDPKAAATPTINPKELERLIDRVENTQLVENDTWFIISMKWWNNFAKAIKDGFISDIGEIDNSPISDKNKKGEYFLKNRLSEGADFQTVPEEVFKRLREVFGLEDDRRDYIARTVVNKQGTLIIEVYPRVVHISNARNKNIKVDLILKHDDTMESLRERAIIELALNEQDNVRFYVMNGENPELVDTSQELDSYFDTAQHVLIDVEENGEFFYKAKTAVQPQSKSLFGASSSSAAAPVESTDSEDSSSGGTGSALQKRAKKMQSSRKAKNRRYSTSTCASLGSKVAWPFIAAWYTVREYWWRFSTMWPDDFRNLFAFIFGWAMLRPPQRIGNGSYGSTSNLGVNGCVSPSNPGQCGLSNLGNTCFMASAIQCLSNMPPLRDYFLSGAYEKDINLENPLGTQGHLAQAVGELFKAMWSGEFTSISPRRFKAIIGQFAPRFGGYSQQDAHELMAYVLDGLHEDLNRIKKKPYCEDNDELAKLPLHEYAEKSWDMYKMRNDSIIVDTLHGQLKSTLICPVCSKISIKFDPFIYLSLPLPTKEQIVKQHVIAIFLERKWAKFALSVTDQTTCDEAEELMLAKLQLESTPHFIFFNIPSSSQYNDDVTLMRPTDTVRRNHKEVFAAEVEHDPTEPGVRIVVAYNRVKFTRACSLPMIYTVKDSDHIPREFITGTILSKTTKFFIHPNKNLESVEADDDSMSGNEGNEPYKLNVCPFGATTPLPVSGDEPIAFPEGSDPFVSYQQVIFIWKDMKLFNQYKGLDLVEREMSVTTRRKVYLKETLDWFTTKEQLGEQDLWYCPDCKSHERATKQLDLWKLPEILVLHLKRFQYTRWSREKLTWDVVIPVKGLDLTEKVANDKHEKAVYDLIAISKHYGSLSGGHYTAAGLNDGINRWIDFNDASASVTVGPVDPFEASDPYMLVYKRRPLDENGEPIDTAGADHGSSNGFRRPKRTHQHHIDENMEMEED